MATKKRPGSARRTLAKQEAARKRGAPGKRFVGETAAQSEKARRDQRRKVARMRSAARKAKPEAAARTAGLAREGDPDAAAAARAVTPDRWDVPSEDVSSAYGGGEPALPAPIGGAIADLARGALRLAATVVTAPIRLALVLPRLALTALRIAS